MGTNLSFNQPLILAKADKPGTSSQSMADVLFTTTQQCLLGLLFGQPGRTFYVTELIKLANIGRGAVQRELARLEQSGLVQTEQIGNRKHFQANPDAPIYDELCSIMLKTVGMPEQVRGALEPLSAQLSLALIYGSVAQQTDTAKSDIDLLVVSDELTLEALYSQLSPAEKRLGRQISPTLYTVTATGEVSIKASRSALDLCSFRCVRAFAMAVAACDANSTSISSSSSVNSSPASFSARKKLPTYVSP